jgi:hypothetical protein
MSEAQAIYSEYDAATEALQQIRMTNHYAYLSWSAEQRLAFDQIERAAQERWSHAFNAWHNLVSSPSASMSQ